MNEHSTSLVLPRVLQRAQEMKFGTEITRSGVRFRLWAPHSDRVSLRIEGGGAPIPMYALPRGWFEIEVDGVGAGTNYMFVLADGTEVPDPASRFQPRDIHGPSEVIDPRAYGWQDAGWRGRPWEEAVLYELHVGTFTQEGTFLAAIDRLDYLSDLGVTAIELMPIADFPGRWNWGYDGAMQFAPDSSYGRPEDLKAFVDAAHARNLMVFLDVVYNHFGPKGNYLNLYTPLFTEKHDTPWGPAVNFDDEGARMVRDFVIANARYWLNEYRFDGLRLDAVHEIHDTGPKHLLQDLAEQVRASTDGRHVHLVAENSDNQAGWLKRRRDLTPGLYTAQWSDDVHHCLHCAVTDESFWYYADFHGRTDLLARALAEGLAYQGEHMQHEDRRKGEPSSYLPPTAFVSFIQNHDQIGNRPMGDRIARLAPNAAVRTLAAINLLSPHIPLLFMGEEWAAVQPFHYFTDMGEELAAVIFEGRKKEYQDSPDAKDPSKSPPDPSEETTFTQSKLKWEERTGDENADWLAFYRRLLRLRHKEIVPRLINAPGHASGYEVIRDGAFRVWWRLGDGSSLGLVANLSRDPLEGIERPSGHELWAEGLSGRTLQPWGACFWLEEPRGDGA